MEHLESSIAVEQERTGGAPSAQTEALIDDEAQARMASAREGLWLRAAYLLAGAVVTGAIFWWLQFSTGSICCGDYDGYYHVRWSQMLWDGLRTGKFPPPFTALPLTTLNPKDYVDHHFLFHVLQMSYSWFGNTVLAAKVGTLVFGALAVLSCYWLVLRYRLRYPLIWLVALLACSTPFLFRMNMAKAMSFSIVLMVAGIYLLFERKYIWLLPLSFLFALTYDMFALLCIAAGLWLLVTMWSERSVRSLAVRRAFVGLLYVGVGSILRFVINPYFPHNLQLFFEHLLMKVTKDDFTARVGGEWYPYNTLEFMTNSFVACVAMVAGYIAYQSGDRKSTMRALFFLAFATILLVANARWKRFAEYWPPFAVLFAAFSMQPILEGARSYLRRLPSDVLDELKPFLDHQSAPVEERQQQRAVIARYAAATIIAVALSLQLIGNMKAASKEISESAPPEHYQKGMEWIRMNVPEGEMIFNTDWDDFPRLFYFSPKHQYVSGLDPTYLLDQNEELFHLYESITLGREKEMARLIRERFRARYVFTDKLEVHDEFYNKAIESGWFEEVYDDDHCTVLRLRDEWREPPPETPAADNPDETGNNATGDDDGEAPDEP